MNRSDEVGLKSGPPGERTWFIADDSTGCARPAVRRAFRRGGVDGERGWALHDAALLGGRAR